MSGARAVLFDLDGTLVDSWALHLRSLQQACSTVGTPPPTAARVRLLREATDHATVVALAGPDNACRAMEAYQEAMLAGAADEVVPMPGASGLLRRLAASGAAVGVCTGRSRRSAVALLRAAGLTVPLLVGREDAARPKPAPDGLLRAAELLGARAHETVFVGDTEMDARQGRAAGIRTIVVGGRAGPAVTGVFATPTLDAIHDLVRRAAQ